MPESKTSSTGIVETAENTIIGITESMMSAPDILNGSSTEKHLYSSDPKIVQPPSVAMSQGMKGAIESGKDDVSRINEQVSHIKDKTKSQLGEKMEYHGENAREKGVEMQGKSQIGRLGEQIKNIANTMNPFKEQ